MKDVVLFVDSLISKMKFIFCFISIIIHHLEMISVMYNVQSIAEFKQLPLNELIIQLMNSDPRIILLTCSCLSSFLPV